MNFYKLSLNDRYPGLFAQKANLCVHKGKGLHQKGKTFWHFTVVILAGAEGLEPTTLGFGDRCSTN